MRTRSRQVPLLATGALFLASLCWGLAPVATRYLLRSFAPLQLVLLRFCIAAILFLPLLITLRSQRWTRKTLVWALFCGLVGIIGYNVPVAYGLQVIPSSIAGLLLATEPIWILLIGALALHEKTSWPLLTGLLLALSGIVLLLGRQTFASRWNMTMFVGAALVLLAALMWSVYTVAVRSLSKELGARCSTALTVVLGTLPLLAFWDNTTCSILVHLGLVSWVTLGLLALGSTVVATMFWNYGVARTASSQAGLFLYLVPLVSVTGGALFLHEPISGVTLLSGGLILAGVVLAQW